MPLTKDLTLSLYSGISETKPWSIFLSDLAELMDSSGASIMVSPPNMHDPILFSYVSNGETFTEFGQTYANEFFASDPFVNLPEGKVFTRHEFLCDLELNELKYYEELEKTGAYYVVGFDIKTRSGLNGCLRISRDKESDEFTAEDKAKLDPFIPHFKEAITLFERLHRLGTEVKSHESALDKMTMAALFVASDGRVLKQNRMAKALLAEKIGVSIRHGVLTFNDRSTHKLFRDSLVEAVLSNKAGGDVIKMVTVTNYDLDRTVHFALRSIVDTDMPISNNTPILAVYAKDPYGHIDVDTETISSLLGLTSKEAILSIHLANHFDLNEVARLMDISHNTARAHLRSIYSKTYITRQSELIGLVLRAGAEMAATSSKKTN